MSSEDASSEASRNAQSLSEPESTQQRPSVPPAERPAPEVTTAGQPEDQLKTTSSPTEGTADVAANSSIAMIKPANDDLSYKHLVLPNELRVLLVSDPSTDKAGAAMDVCVGSISDPDDFPGLAHFTEHMLFYSSAKYPVEDEYTKFISDRGGTTNAYTSAEHTNYHFDINWESLEPALDRFAQFFIAPTISEDGIEREVRAVDSEHGKNLSSDPWRKAQVNKTTANRQHPWTRFSTGNRDTLYSGPLAAGSDPRAAVVDFYNRHYSANRCALAVLGRQSVGELETMVRSMFSEVPNKHLPRPVFSDNVFLPEQVGVLLRVVPVREGQSLEMVWQVPPSERLYREQPLGYLSHLLGHEGEGSVFALLKSRGWASSLVAGETGGALTFSSFFTVHVELTQEGQRHIRDVATTVFSYIDLLRQPGGINDGIWEEVRGLAQLHFDTRDKSKPMSYCTSLAAGLQAYPHQDLLPALYGVPSLFSPEVIRQALQLLTPERVRVFWISKIHLGQQGGQQGDKEGKQQNEQGQETRGQKPEEEEEGKQGGGGEEELLRTEPIYGTRYGIGPLPADWLRTWAAARRQESGLYLPAPNRFIPTDLSLAADESSASGPHPEVALAVPGRLRLWHKPDTRFGQPKAVLYLDVQSPEAYSSPRAAVLTRLFVKLMLDYLNEVAYPAQQAGLDYNLLNTQSGWQLLLGGYNHKLPELLGEVLERLAGFKVLPDRFEFVREGLVREYANQLHNQPYSWAMYRAEMLTTARRWPIELYGTLAAAVTADELSSFVRRLTSRCFVEGLAAGNMRRREALRCGAMVLSCLRDRCGAQPLHTAEMADLRVLRLPPTPQEPEPAAEAVPVPPAAEATGAEAQAAATGTSGGPTVVEGGAKEEGEEGGGGPCACSGGWLLVEDVPNDQDENSAAVVQYQVGPDDLRRNALRGLLVQLTKRDAFSELRTRQQLGYIVSLHAGAEHGVGYVELLVQSNAHDADDLCRRMDEFAERFLVTDLPAKCGQTPAETDPAAPAAAGPQPEDTPASTATSTAGNPKPAPTEFQVAVDELAKSKLEKPKKLTELASRWWSEVHHGCYQFDRREAEVAELRSITPEEMQRFAREVLAGAGEAAPRRKLSVQVRGKAEAARAAAAAAAAGSAAAPSADSAAVPAPPATAGGTSTAGAAAAAPAAAEGVTATAATDASGTASRPRGRLPYAVIPTADPFTWKRGCDTWPAVRAMWAARSAATGRPPLPGSVAEAEVEGLMAEVKEGEAALAAAGRTVAAPAPAAAAAMEGQAAA